MKRPSWAPQFERAGHGTAHPSCRNRLANSSSWSLSCDRQSLKRPNIRERSYLSDDEGFVEVLSTHGESLQDLWIEIGFGSLWSAAHHVGNHIYDFIVQISK